VERLRWGGVEIDEGSRPPSSATSKFTGKSSSGLMKSVLKSETLHLSWMTASNYGGKERRRF